MIIYLQNETPRNFRKETRARMVGFENVDEIMKLNVKNVSSSEFTYNTNK